MSGASTPNTLVTAQGLEGLGISVLRMLPNLQKRPDGNWKQYQNRRATKNELNRWFAGGAPIGVVTGAVSGNLTMAEIEGRAAHRIPELEQVARDSGLGHVWDKVNASWVERSPSGGLHWFYRTAEPPAGNQKLASRESTPEELEEWKQFEREKASLLPEPQSSARLEKIAATTSVRFVLTETRGEGGYVVVAPTAGQYHESGRPWEWVNTPDNLVTLTGEEADQFLTILRTLDEPIPEPTPTSSPFSQGAAQRGMIDGTRPGDDFDRETWENILEPHGWRKLHKVGKTQFWLRPGKEARDGHSASTGHADDRDRMWVFTTSTELPAETPLTKFAVHAHLNHGGNYSAAASDLAKSGWGQPAEVLTSAPPRTLTSTIGPDTRQDNPDSGQTSQRPAAPTNTPSPITASTVTDIATKRAEKQSTIAHTDDGNASLFINEHSSIVRYNSENGRWLVWEKAVWKVQPKNHRGAMELAKITTRGLPVNNEEARKWRTKSGSVGAHKAILTLASTDARIAVNPDDLDNLPYELNTPDGPVDLRTGRLLPPDPTKMHTKQTKCVPDFDADRSRWLQFLAETFPSNQPMIDYVQRLAGYTLIGEVLEHIIPFLHGGGGNGKGVLVETFQELLGDYATPVHPELLMKQFGSRGHPTELATLSGARMAVSSEINPTAKFDEARMNLLSGGDRINARFMGMDEFGFKPTHQLWLSGNHQPTVDGGGGAGFWRRLRLIPFTHTVPEEKVDKTLKGRFTGELGPSILAWMIEGAAAYLQDGSLREPQQVTQATADYRKDAQTVKRFIEEECELGGGTQFLIPIGDFRNRYERWCTREGVPPIKGNSLRQQAIEAGLQDGGRNKTSRFYANVQFARDRDEQFYPAPEEPPAEQ